MPTVYDATRYDVLAQQTHLIKPYEKTMPESGDSVKYTPTKFDEVGRVKRLESLDKFGNKNVQIFDYDAVGRVTRYADNNSDYVYTYDMLGNIYEWCLDRYAADLGTEDVTDPLTEQGTGRVIRGSRYNLTWTPYVRTTFRTYQTEGKAVGQLQGYGFRVMCPLTLKFPEPEAEEPGEDADEESATVEGE